MFVDTHAMLLDALRGGYAVGAFNVENLEMAMAVVAEAESLSVPVILQTTPGTLRYARPAVFAGMIAPIARAARVPVALHLDHGDSFDLAMEAAGSGYTSVMIDGSKLPFVENIALTRQTVAAVGGLPVEGELGCVGGKEDDHSADNRYTDPLDALRFVRETGVSSLAVAIGTAHGVYAAKPALDLDRLGEIRQKVDIPLVLHGASGLSPEDVRACVRRGVQKVNFATDLRIAYTAGVRVCLKDEKVFDPKAYGRAGMEAVRAAVREKISWLRP